MPPFSDPVHLLVIFLGLIWVFLFLNWNMVSVLTYLAVISIFVIDSCMKTIGVHDRVFDVNDKVENSLEPAG